MLDDPRRARVRAELMKHRRAISPQPHHPHGCLCGWSGNGNVGHALADHLTDIILDAVDLKDPAECPAPSLDTITRHRMDKEALCKGCEQALSTLS